MSGSEFNPARARCIRCGAVQCSHPELSGRTFSQAQWELLPDILPPTLMSPLGIPKKAVYYRKTSQE